MRWWVSRRLAAVILWHVNRKHSVIVFTDGESARGMWDIHKALHGKEMAKIMMAANRKAQKE